MAATESCEAIDAAATGLDLLAYQENRLVRSSIEVTMSENKWGIRCGRITRTAGEYLYGVLEVL